MHTFYSSYPCGRVCLSSDDPSTCAAAVADVVLQGMKLYIPSTEMPIGGKSQPWFDMSCKLAASSKRKAYQIWAEALVTKDPEVKTSKRKYNRASRFFKRKIARAKSEHIAKMARSL